MSPWQALHSPVFLLYLVLAVGLLVVAGVILAAFKWGLRKNVAQAWSAYRGWLFMVPILLLVFFLGREAVVVFLTIVAFLGFQEFARASGLLDDWGLAAVVHLGIIATGISCLMTDSDGKPGCFDQFMVVPIFVSAAILAIPVIRNHAQGQLRLIALAILGFVYFGWMFGHVAFLANSTHPYSYLGFLVAAVELNDVAAYTAGKLFGRHLLRSNISPKKTWEGALGGLAMSMLLPWVLLFTFPHFKAWDCIVVGLMVGIGGQVGDLVISVFKRDLGIKDMGTAIPGHGGILDRVDSLIYVAPLYLHYLRYRFEFRIAS